MSWTLRKLREEVLAGPMSVTYALSEGRELLEEIKALNPEGIRDEWSDFVLSLSLALYEKGVLPGGLRVLPGLGQKAAEKYYSRLEIWEDIFTAHGKAFKKEFLLGGGNPYREEKVAFVLGKAGVSPEEINFRAVKEILFLKASR